VAAAPKKRMGFLQRMKSSSSGYAKPAAPSAASTANDGARSPTAPLRKGYSTSTPGLASSAQRSVSPLGALLSSTKSSTSAQPSKLTPIGKWWAAVLTPAIDDLLFWSCLVPEELNYHGPS
jgi:hypothetical protein